MNVTDYTYLINKPDAITEKQTEALGNVLIEFPYFQSARALRLKGLYNQNSFKYNYALKVTAAHTTDRSVLFDFITSESFTSIQNEFYNRKLRDLLNINVLDSEIVSVEETKKIPEAKIDPLEQSILTSIRQATLPVYEEPVKVEEEYIESATEETISNPIEETTLADFEEVTETEEKPVDHIIEETISAPAEETPSVVFEEAIKTEDAPIIIEPTETSVEETIVPFEEDIKTEEQPIETIKEEVIIAPVKERITFFDEVVTDEIEEDPIIEKSVSTSIVETTPSIEEEKKFREIRIDPIEESIYNSIKESTTVVFEESKPSETSIVEEPKFIEELPKEVATVVFEEVKTIEEESNEVSPVVLEQPQTIEEDSKEIITVILEEPTFVEETQEAANVISEPVKITEEDPIEPATVFVEEQKVIEEPKEIQLEETVKNAEENLEIGKPLDFSVNEKHSFQEWLQLARPEPIDRTNEVTPVIEKVEAIKKIEDVTEIKQIEQTPEPVIENVVEEKIVIETEVAEEDEKKKKAELINKFIKTNPKIPPVKATATTLPPIQFDINQEDNSYLMTETLARVYLEQKKYTKAIQAYEILILKYPEKISFFADRISDIKILQQNNNNK
ncbi:hypothetical protein EV143_10322 [Flavobacterium chryseum]|uniref:tetratricopeptide repeat protein n=1 Tax=Flavobacterium sp. P3160 TaxID=2512113 RepID=UPI0010E98C47|nr:tetratricopeptide repeat protein [Flavobacterium sp. P3160]TDO77790.1 hypothetical protein EV143_10322 [Flavobacterium sp. P3160]